MTAKTKRRKRYPRGRDGTLLDWYNSDDDLFIKQTIKQLFEERAYQEDFSNLDGARAMRKEPVELDRDLMNDPEGAEDLARRMAQSGDFSLLHALDPEGAPYYGPTKQPDKVNRPKHPWDEYLHAGIARTAVKVARRIYQLWEHDYGMKKRPKGTTAATIAVEYCRQHGYHISLASVERAMWSKT